MGFRPAVASKRRPKSPAKKPEPLVRKNGRPFAYADREQAMRLLSGLGSIMATYQECCDVLGVSTTTLARIYERWPEVKDAYETGKTGGKVALRRTQFDLAKRNSTMAIFLGLNYLDQQDLRNVNLGGKVDHVHEHLVVHAMLQEIDKESRAQPLIEHDPHEFDSQQVAGPNEEAA